MSLFQQTRLTQSRTTMLWWLMLWLVLFVGLSSYSKALMLSHELSAETTKTYVVFGQAVKICSPSQNKTDQNTANTSNHHCDACVLAFVHVLAGVSAKFDFEQSSSGLSIVSTDQFLSAFESVYHSRAPPNISRT